MMMMIQVLYFASTHMRVYTQCFNKYLFYDNFGISGSEKGSGCGLKYAQTYRHTFISKFIPHKFECHFNRISHQHEKNGIMSVHGSINIYFETEKYLVH